MKVIFHLDLDSYFVAAHRSIDPSLENKAVVVSGGKRRSIITAASYEAKAKGIYVPMPFYQVKNLLPEVITIKPNYPLYTNLSAKLFDFLASHYTPLIEIASIDECYLDVTSIWKNYHSPYKLALDIQKTIKQKFRLPISIGISNNKFVAKMSTQINKPSGITITKSEDFLKRFGDWSILDFHGIGKPTAQKLATLKIYTINDLAKAKIAEVEILLGKVAKSLIEQANGNGAQELDDSHNELKGIGNSLTFQDYDRSDYQDILKTLYSLCELVGQRAVNRNVVGSVIAISIKAKGGKEIKSQSKQKTLAIPLQKTDDIFQISKELFDNLWKGEVIKFLGISLNNLSNMFETTYQANLFDEVQINHPSKEIVRKVNQMLQYKGVKTGVEFKKTLKGENKQTRYLSSEKIIKHFDSDYKKNK